MTTDRRSEEDRKLIEQLRRYAEDNKFRPSSPHTLCNLAAARLSVLAPMEGDDNDKRARQIVMEHGVAGASVYAKEAFDTFIAAIARELTAAEDRGMKAARSALAGEGK